MPAEVERDAALAGVEQIVEAARAAARAVGTVTALDPDHIGAQRVEQMRAQRPRPQAAQIDDARRPAGRGFAKPTASLHNQPRRGAAGRLGCGRTRYGHTEQRRALLEHRRFAIREQGCESRPGRLGTFSIVRKTGLEPRAQRASIVIASQTDSQPAVAAAQQPRRAACRDGRAPAQSRQRGALPEKRGRVDVPKIADRKTAALRLVGDSRQSCAHADRCGSDSFAAPLWRTTGRAGQRHCAAGRPQAGRRLVAGIDACRVKFAGPRQTARHAAVTGRREERSRVARLRLHRTHGRILAVGRAPLQGAAARRPSRSGRKI